MRDNELMAYRPTPETLVWRQGMAEWKPLYNFPELMSKLNRSTTPPPYPRGVETVYSTSGKDKVAAGVLAILLGEFGVQYFYIGKIGGGFICLLLTIVTLGLWSIVSLVQGILMLTMTQEQFDEKYVLTPKVFPLF